ncbi:MAG TPA: PKD domain-containing protein [Bacteroidales bacterium]|nr:PKD domain-containing protein [Bacteroidales bacterium]HSA42264.1 PKD domain-containing protein [Bacteroidales bacterium]
MNRLLLFTFIIPLLTAWHAGAQTCRDVSVELSATVQANPPRITLNWVNNAGATQYQVFRKLKHEQYWTGPLASLAGNINQYTDQTVSAGIAYEYRLIRSASNYTGYGYILSGIAVPPVENRGKLILLVDNTCVSFCAAGLSRLEEDLAGDGWTVIRHNVSRTAAAGSIKTLILNTYNLDPANTKAVFLFGHVPVPYSGNINPDGHSDHQGAWPADVYYADVDGVWTDVTINNTSASSSRNHNIPGDGKFDQSILPSNTDLMTGRVDLANMPAFSSSEQQLLNNYLDKNHQYRHKAFTPVVRAVIDDNFGYFSGEAFAASGWKSFGPLVSPANVSAADYFTSMTGNSYLWSYGCGGGSYTSAGGIGNTTNFAASNLQGVFTILFGSYFGDWDSNNNFLRAPLAQGSMLTDAWSGRPHWQFHHMGLGEPIGYSTLVSQNNSGLYYAGYGARFIHIALMGDPTLRNDVLAPPTNLLAVMNTNHTVLTWSPSPDNVLGYYIYRKYITDQEYTRITPDPVVIPFYTDSCLADSGTFTYMVRAIALQTNASGSYYNLSQGIFDSVWHDNLFEVTAMAAYTLQNNMASFTNSSVNAGQYLWDFGDGSYSTEAEPQHQFLPGSYTVTLIASNDCDADTLVIQINGLQWNTLSGVLAYQNAGNTGMPYTYINLLDGQGNLVATTMTQPDGTYFFDDLPNGTYQLVPIAGDAGGGVNATDALVALRHFVHLTTLTGLYFIAADVDQNAVVNAIDALMISKKFTGQLSAFPAGDWYFEQPVLELNGYVNHIHHLHCICYGDCNGSYNPWF